LGFRHAIGAASGQRLAQGGTGLGRRQREVLHRFAAYGGAHAPDVGRAGQARVELRPLDAEFLAGDLFQCGKKKEAATGLTRRRLLESSRNTRPACVG
jgi:hypothetical protein